MNTPTSTQTPRSTTKAARPLYASVAAGAPVQARYPGAALLGLPQTGAGIIEAIAAGLEFGALDALSRVLELSPSSLAQILHLSNSTFLRRKKEGRLQPDESDRLVRLSQISALAIDLFEGDAGAAGRWLTRPHRALGGSAPIQYSQTHIGVQEVQDLIGRLEEGVLG